MNRDSDETLKDMMIGEALIAILDDNATVSAGALLIKLQSMAETEQTGARKRACVHAIAELQSSLTGALPPKREGR